MPLTLGCPSCGRRFRARDESAGRRVRCPFCRAVVGVPSLAEIHNAAAPTEVVAAARVPAPFPLAGSELDPAAPAERPALLTPPPADDPEPAPGDAPTVPVEVIPVGGPLVVPPPDPEPPPIDLTARGWDRADRGLFWVEFGLVWLAVAGCVRVGAGWAAPLNESNSPLGVLPYAAPGMVGLLAVLLGRVLCAAAPAPGVGRLSAASAAGVLAVVAGLFAAAWFARHGNADGVRAAAGAALVAAVVAEFWFLLGLGLVGAALARPGLTNRTAAAGACLGLAGWATAIAGDSAVCGVAALAAWGLAFATYLRALRAARNSIDDWFQSATEARV